MLLLALIIQAQNNPEWDDTTNKNWPSQFHQIEISSTLDGEIQKVYIHFSKSKTPKPLIISLHTWSGDYVQKDPLISKIIKEDWNYIHPNFRGFNNKAKACGSKFVISDIDDAKLINCIVILLGTNDCKAIFDDRLKEVPRNLEKLILSIQNSNKFNETPRIIVVSPPPYDADEILLEKYKGASERVHYLIPEFEKVANKTGVEFLDIHSPLEPVFNILSHDGVHLSEEGQTIIAKLIDRKIDF